MSGNNIEDFFEPNIAILEELHGDKNYGKRIANAIAKQAHKQFAAFMSEGFNRDEAITLTSKVLAGFNKQ